MFEDVPDDDEDEDESEEDTEGDEDDLDEDEISEALRSEKPYRGGQQPDGGTLDLMDDELTAEIEARKQRN